MNARVILGGLLAVVCLATLWGVWSQRGQLASLRADQQQLLSRVAASAERPAPPVAAPIAGDGSVSAPATPIATPELLRLRSEVTRLAERRRELEGVRAENERLRAQLASRGTNGPGGYRLPPGYVRRSDARLVGYNTPEDTLQSLLWALRNRDLTNLLQAFTPEQAEKVRAQASGSAESMEEFFNEAQGLVGMRILNREQGVSHGSIVVHADVELLPGEDGPRITFLQTNGQWKISRPF